MVLSWDITKIVKKKFSATLKDKKAWIAFTKQMGNVSPKETDFVDNNINKNEIKKLDLHGLQLNEANKIVKKFIIDTFNNGCRKLIIITGKGFRSKSHNNPYLSEKLSVLKYSVPEYIINDEDLREKISKISKASQKDGGEGAFYIFLKKTGSLQNKLW